MRERNWPRRSRANATRSSACGCARFSRTADRPIDPTRLRNALPDYLDRLVESPRGESTLDTGGTAAWVDIAREHAVTRVHLGFNIRQLVHEFAILRRVIVGVVRRTASVTLDVEQMEVVAELIESAIAEAVDSYVRAHLTPG